MFANAYTMRNCPKHRRTGYTLPRSASYFRRCLYQKRRRH